MFLSQTLACAVTYPRVVVVLKVSGESTIAMNHFFIMLYLENLMAFNWLENSKFKYLITYENRRIYVTWISTQSLSMEYLASWLFLPSQITFCLNIACYNFLVATCLSSLFIHSIYGMFNWLWSESLIGCFKLGLNFIIKSQTKFSRAKLRKCINVMLFTTWIWQKYTIRAITRTSSHSHIINKDHCWKGSACGKHSSKILLFFFPPDSKLRIRVIVTHHVYWLFRVEWNLISIHVPV